MNIVFEPEPPRLRWVAAAHGQVRQGLVDGDSGEVLEQLGRAADGSQVQAVGCVTPHGGDVLAAAATPTTPALLETLSGARRCCWDGCQMALAAARAALSQWPAARHYLLCETGFFSRLPAPARRYAVPEAVARTGVGRYGGNGLCHGWVWQRLAAAGAAPERLVSVYLGSVPDVVAVHEGEAVETTIGFTPVEGLPSMRACGDLDATVALQLCEAGYSPAEVGDLLTRRSGLSGLVGREVSLDEVAGGTGPEIHEARELLVYALVKAVGASAGVMGGADAIVFSAPTLEPVLPLARAVSARLEFMGLAPLQGVATEAGWQSLGPGRVAIEARRSDVLLSHLERATTQRRPVGSPFGALRFWKDL